MKNSTLAIVAVAAETPEKPRNPATIEMTRKMRAHFSMALSSDLGSENAISPKMFQMPGAGCICATVEAETKVYARQGFYALPKFHIVELQTVATARRILAGDE